MALHRWARSVTIVAVRNTPDRSGTTDDERWAAAMSVLERMPTATARQRLRRFRWRTWTFVISVLVLAPALALLLLVVAGGAFDADPDPSQGWVVAGLVVQMSGVVVLFVFLVTAWRGGLFRGAWSQPTAVLDRAERRSLLAQVRGRAPVDQGQLPLARYLAERLVAQRHQVLLMVGVALQQIGRAIGSPGPLNLGMTGLVLVAYAVGLLLLRRDAGRAERFLAAHPAGAQEG